MREADNNVTIDLDSVVQRNNSVLTARLDEELAMLNIERGMYYGLDEIATHIWEKIAEPRRVSDVCNELIDEFDVSADRCQRETLVLLDWLNAQNLLKIHGEADC